MVGRRRARQGQILFLEGDAGDKTYVVCSGTVDLVLGSAKGDQITLGQVGPGGFLGEMALLDDEPRSATAIVSQTADLLTISRQDLIAHLYGHPETMLNLIRALSRRLRAGDDRIRTMRFLDVGGRLAKTLLSLDQPPGRRVPISCTARAASEHGWKYSADCLRDPWPMAAGGRCRDCSGTRHSGESRGVGGPNRSINL